MGRGEWSRHFSGVAGVECPCLFQVYFTFSIQIDLPNCQITESRPPDLGLSGSGPFTLSQNSFPVAVLAVLAVLAVAASRGERLLFGREQILPAPGVLLNTYT